MPNLIQSFSFLTLGKLVGDIFTFGFFVLITRVFGEEGIGQYSFAMGLTSFYAIFAEFGLYHYSIKEGSCKKDSLKVYYGSVFSLRIILSLCMFGVLLFSLIFFPFSYNTKLIVGIIGSYQILYALIEGLAAFFIAKEDAHLAAIMDSAVRCTTGLIGIVCIAIGWSLVGVLATISLTTLGGLFFSYRMLVRRYGRLQLTLSSGLLLKTLRAAFPYAQSSFLFPLTSRLDVVLLGFFLGASSAGIYNVAYRVIFLLQFIPYLASVAIFPLATKLRRSTFPELEALYQTSLSFVVLLGLPMAAGLWFIAPDLINRIFGSGFSGSASILRILVVLLALLCASHIMAVFLMACNLQSNRMKFQWVSGGLNAVGNFCLIPLWGMKGAAYATVLSELLLVLMYTIHLKSIFGWPRVGSKVGMSVVAIFSFSLLFIFFGKSLPIVLLVLCSLIIYTGTLTLFRDFRENELEVVMAQIRKFVKGKDRESTGV